MTRRVGGSECTKVCKNAYEAALQYERIVSHYEQFSGWGCWRLLDPEIQAANKAHALVISGLIHKVHTGGDGQRAGGGRGVRAAGGAGERVSRRGPTPSGPSTLVPGQRMAVKRRDGTVRIGEVLPVNRRFLSVTEEQRGYVLVRAGGGRLARVHATRSVWPLPLHAAHQAVGTRL